MRLGPRRFGARTIRCEQTSATGVFRPSGLWPSTDGMFFLGTDVEEVDAKSTKEVQCSIL